MESLNDTAVILRECGERTAEFAYGRLCRIFGEGSVLRVTGIPFSEALAESYRAGISQGRAWTLCIDADVFCGEAGLRELIDEMREEPEATFEIQGLVFDKFLGIWRPAGNHLYRTSLLERAFGMIPREGSLRPESDTLKAMAGAGFPWRQSRVHVGFHDFEQSFRDIYKKNYLQAFKHRDFLGFPSRMWEALANGDDDFGVASKAVRDALRSEGEALVDRRFAEDAAEKALASLGLEEKPSLASFPTDVQLLGAMLDPLPTSMLLERESFEKSMHEKFFSDSRPRGQGRRLGKIEARVERIERRIGKARPEGGRRPPKWFGRLFGAG